MGRIKALTFAYEYDGFNHMVKAESIYGTKEVCRYDAEDLRYEIEENGELVRFIFNDSKVVHEESNTDNIRYIRGNDLIASDSEQAKTYYHYASDERGSITHVFDDNGSLMNRYQYDAFGNVTAASENVKNRFRYTGEQLKDWKMKYLKVNPH